jgi:hypothetical protein
MSFIKIGPHKYKAIEVRDIKPEMKILLDRLVTGRVISCTKTSRNGWYEIILETSGGRYLAQKKYSTRVGLFNDVSRSD